ncbi:MAG: hypothetical protein ACRC0G_10665 [Fusobacteriaceae bacterium]
MQNVQVKGINSKSAPFIAVEADGYFQVGDTVRIEDMNSLSHMTMGTLVGLTHRGADKAPMALVNWLENAPPIRILMTKLVRLKPVKFWMVCGDIEGDFVRDETPARQRDGTISPAKKFFDKEAAKAVALSLSTRNRRNYILLESVEFVSNETSNFARV